MGIVVYIWDLNHSVSLEQIIHCVRARHKVSEWQDIGELAVHILYL
jgi:hypothetical protein